AEADLGSEFRYRDALVGPETLVVAISQSGETADTLGAVKAARLKGCPILAITNVVGSALAREATGVLYMHAGPEIGVASTKAFSTMIVATYLLGLWLGRHRGAITAEDVKKRIHDLVEIPRLVAKTLELDGQVAGIVRELAGDRACAAKEQSVTEVPASADLSGPLITGIPLQRLAYHISVRLGRDVDQPRNLAKSVTVE